MKSVVKNKAFTIVELLVAMSLLVILLGLSGMVFNTTVAAHRAAGATIDITRTLRAVTDQLNADFQGLRKDAPLFLALNYVDTDGDLVPDSHFDTIHFFADGDFQTMRQYDYDDEDADLLSNGVKTIYANVARIYYGHANTVDAYNAGIVDYSGFTSLSRKTSLLTVDGQIMRIHGEIPVISNYPTSPVVIDYGLFDNNFGITPIVGPSSYENTQEFSTITLNNWINALNYLEGGVPNNANVFIANCMADASRPMVDLTDINTLHLLLSQGVVQMKIQWAYEPGDLTGPVVGFTSGIRWWPSVDPDGDGNFSDSDFDVMKPGNVPKQFGVHFELTGGSSVADWFPIWGCGTSPGVGFQNTFYPKALKFTFVLRDSNGLFADGKTFTHIVYLDN